MDTANIITLNSENFRDATAMADKLVLVDFWAKWCAPCRAVAPILERLAGEYPEKLLIGKLDIDEQREIAIEFGISSIPTIQLYKDGKMIDALVGSRPYKDYKAVVESYI
ncbi:MAG: thioredoxin [Oscillospiraceae bacterium]|nr:thioredoxin [Oscillospiraceae bacterium]